MAQMGCYVPATSCEMTIVDRIFTRIGANDNLMKNQSTFMVELAETSAILAHSTEHSLLILDELGRGTSTFDGYSIAFSVLNYFTQHPRRMLFSTHYHLLTDEFKHNPMVALYQMATIADEERKLVFLYKIEKGMTRVNNYHDIL